MLTSIWDDIKRQFNYGDVVTRIIIVNVAVFIVINLLKVFLHHGNGGSTPGIYMDLRNFFCMSSDPYHFITHPWGMFTHMFMHEGFMHILFNMLFLYWFGRIVEDLVGNKRILPLFLLGGLSGAALYFISANLLPPEFYKMGKFALGASGGVMAVVVAAGVLAPDYSLRLILIGDVKLKYIVAVIFFVDLIGTTGDVNTGGHFAHIGGALFGWFFVASLRKGDDLSEPVNNTIDKLSMFFNNIFKGKKDKRRHRPKVVYRNKDKKVKRSKPHASSDTEKNLSHQGMLDAILDKIKEDGYESLSDAEKEFLFKASNKK